MTAATSYGIWHEAVFVPDAEAIVVGQASMDMHATGGAAVGLGVKNYQVDLGAVFDEKPPNPDPGVSGALFSFPPLVIRLLQ